MHGQPHIRDDLLLYVQQPATDPFRVPGAANSRYYINFFDIRFSINLPSTKSMTSVGPLSFRFPPQKPLWIYLLPRPCHSLSPPHSPWSDHPNNKNLKRFQ